MAIKVLMLLPSLEVSSGVSSYVMNYFRAIDHNEIHMDFAVWHDCSTPYYDELRAKGSKVFVLPSLKNIIKHISECNNIFRQEHYDIVHDNTLLISYPIMAVAKANRVPVRVLHSHNSKLGESQGRELRNKFFLPLLKGCATDYVACSELAAKAMFGEKSYEFIPNVVVSKSLRYDDVLRKQLRRKMNVDGKVVVGTVGRVALQKNPFFAVDVMDVVLDNCDNVEYWWIGSGKLDEEFKKYIEKKKNVMKMHFLGSREDVIDLYQAMDIFFLPSVFEGLPVTAIEAQAMGLKLILSDSITKQLIYTDLVRYVSLNDNLTHWAGVIQDTINGLSNRRGYTNELENSLFFDKTAGERLLNVYKKFIN